MRVLLVTDWPPGMGGTERYMATLRHGLEGVGDEVRLLTSSVGSAAEGSADYVAYGSRRTAEQVGLQVFNPFAARTVRRAIREFRPDTVHLSMFLPHLSPSVLGPLRPVPTVLTICDPKPVCTKDSKLLPDDRPCHHPPGAVCVTNGCVGRARFARDVPRYGLLRRGLRHVDRVHTISRWMQEALAEGGIVAERVDLPVAPPASEFRRAPAEEPLFVFGGRLSREKGVDILLRAFARVRKRFPTARLLIAGDGPDRRRLTALADGLELGPSTEFSIGMRDDWVAELAPAWALVAPSVQREPLGLVAIEAIVHGVPVIATEGGGFAETVEERGSGLIVARRDVGALANAMAAVAECRRFPDHSIDPAIVDGLRRRHDPEGHLRMMRTVYDELRSEAVAA